MQATRNRKARLRLELRKGRTRVKKKAKDPNRPKKPTGGAYGVFLAENRAKIVTSLPTGHKITDVAKTAGEQFKALSEEQKKPYHDKYLKKQEEYKKALEDYKAANPDADDEEEEGEEDEKEESSPENG